jgi:hypothetical protein
MTKEVYLESKKNYFAVKYDFSDRLNAGAIEKLLTSSFNCILNAKLCLIDGIKTAGGNFCAQGYTSAGMNGATRTVGGTGYIGWREAGKSIDDAIAYLQKYFTVKFCDAATQLDLDLIRKGYRSCEWDNQRGQRVYTKQGCCTVIVIPKLTPISSSPEDIDDMFTKIQDGLKDVLAQGGTISDLYLPGGGTTPIPDWFKDWCRQNGIRLHVMDVEQCNRRGLKIG